MKEPNIFHYLVAAFATLTGADVGDPQIKAHIHLLTGLEATKRGKTQTAIHHLKKVIAYEPDNAEAHLALGTGLLNSAKPEEAMKHLIFVLANEPNNAEAQIALASSMALKRLKREGLLPEA